MLSLEKTLNASIESVEKSIEENNGFGSLLQFNLQHGSQILPVELSLGQLLDETGIYPEMIPTVIAFFCAMKGNVLSIFSASYAIRVDRKELPENVTPEQDLAQIVEQYGSLENHPDAKEVINFFIDDGKTIISATRMLEISPYQKIKLSPLGEAETLDSQKAGATLHLGGLLQQADIISTAYEKDLHNRLKHHLEPLPRENAIFEITKKTGVEPVIKCAEVARLLVKSYIATGKFFWSPMQQVNNNESNAATHLH